jgi:glycosyltransferase involved in cell wall biosynthesis
VLVDVERPKQIAQAMLALATDREQAQESVAYGRKMILERFSPDRVINAHLSYYQDVVESWKRGGQRNA